MLFPSFDTVRDFEGIEPWELEGRAAASQAAANQTGNMPVRVLLVSPLAEDHAAATKMLQGSKWKLSRAHDIGSALARLAAETRISVVVCERDLRTGTWKDIFSRLGGVRRPEMVVISRLADHELWSEALNLGAYDVLAKPLDAGELARALNSAWLHWRRRHMGIARGNGGAECEHAASGA